MKIRLFEAGNSVRKLPQNLVDEDKKLLYMKRAIFIKILIYLKKIM